MKESIISKAIVIISLSMVIGLLSGCGHEHQWVEATCTEPKTCSECGETEGEAAGHKWIDASCNEAKHCSVCGVTEGESLGHEWQDATCTEPVTCSRCGETAGNALGHKWEPATCLEPKRCSVCGETDGEAQGHQWLDATYDAPKTCAVCGETEGEPLYYDIPAGFTEGYEFGEFSRFNSYAKDNGLGDTKMWITGEYDSVFSVDLEAEGTPVNAFCAVFTDVDGNEWFLQLGLDYFENKEKYENLNGHRICVIGRYQGYSDVYKMPACFIKSIFDQRTGNSVSSVWYESVY